MKITIVTGAFFPVPPIMGGAVEKVWFALGQEFVRQGHEVVQISRAHPQLPATEEIAGVRHRRISGFAQPRSIVRLKLLDLLYSLRVRRVLPEADILVTNTFWLPLLVRGTDRGLVYVHVQRGPKGQMRWYGHVARLCAVSRAIADGIIAEAPQLRDKVRVLPNALPFRIEGTPSRGAGDERESRGGVVAGGGDPGSLFTDALRGRGQRPPLQQPRSGREQTLLFVGRVHPEKGVELFLRALGHLPGEALADWQVKIVGPHETELGGGGEAFLQTMQALGRKSGASLEWLGKIFNPADLMVQYRSALLFIYPSVAETGEALPVAPLEAMANGCAPIVSGLACFSDYIEDNVTGFVFDHRAAQPAQNLAARLTEVLGLGREKIMNISKAAQAKAAEFDVAKVAPRYLEDFASLLAAPPAKK